MATGPNEPDAVVPFAVDREQAGAVLRGWLRSLRFAPNRLKQVVGADSLTDTYLPHWAFSGQAATTFAGERGKHYWVSHTKTSTDGRGHAATTTHQHRHTRWSPTHGSFNREFEDVLVTATRQQDAKWLSRVGPWPLEQAEPCRPEHGAGLRSAPCELGREEGLAEAKATMLRVIERDCREHIGGDDQRVHAMETDYSQVECRLVLLPAWVGSYRYGGKTWQVVINGSTGRLYGERPYSRAKIGGLLAAGIALLAAITTLLVLSF
jgi:hypothetical protein